MGITSDELLAGELNKENKTKDKKKIPPTFIKIAITVIALITIIVALLVYYNNKTYAYNISNTYDEYNIEGEVVFHGDNISIIVNKLHFKDPNFSSTIIKNYEYQINSGNEHIIRYGYISTTNLIHENIVLEDFMKNFNINYNGRTQLKRSEILKNGIIITLVFLDEHDNEITKKIKMQFNN